MRKSVLAAIAVLAIAIVAAPASAKELGGAKVCGKTDCAKIPHSDQKTLMAFASAEGTPNDDPPAGEFYTVKLFVLDEVGKKHGWWIDYYPAENLIRVDGEFGDWDWYEVNAPNEGLTRIIKNVEPFPAGAFDLMTEMPPGAFTYDQKDLEKTLPDYSSDPAPAAKTDSKPATTPASSSSGTSWLIPGLVIAGLAVLGVGVLGLQRRRAAGVAGTSHPFV